MSRGLCVLAALAVLASGCANRRAVERLESDVGRLRAELSELRVAQEATSRNLANASSQLQALDVRALADEVARLNRRADAADAALADARVKLDMLATPPAVASAPPAPPSPGSSPVPAPLPPAPAVMSPVPAPLPPDPAVMTPAPSNRAAVTPPPAPLPPPAAMAPPPTPASPPAPPSAAAVDKLRVPSPAIAPARPAPKGAGNPEQEYAAALATYRAREHGQAVIEFMDFIAKYPKHPLAGNAQYWIGEAYWAQRDYRQALVEFDKVFEHGQAKAPDALLKIGLCHLRLNDVSRAQQAWQRVVNEYPKSEPATMARSLIATHAARR
jgi:tol-pal system protein YbgF